MAGRCKFHQIQLLQEILNYLLYLCLALRSNAKQLAENKVVIHIKRVRNLDKLLLTKKSDGKINERRKSTSTCQLKSILIRKDLPFSLCGRRRKSVSFITSPNGKDSIDSLPKGEINAMTQPESFNLIDVSDAPTPICLPVAAPMASVSILNDIGFDGDIDDKTVCLASPIKLNKSILERHGPAKRVYDGPRKRVPGVQQPIPGPRKPVPNLIPLRRHPTIASELILDGLKKWKQQK